MDLPLTCTKQYVFFVCRPAPREIRAQRVLLSLEEFTFSAVPLFDRLFSLILFYRTSVACATYFHDRMHSGHSDLMRGFDIFECCVLLHVDDEIFSIFQTTKYQ